VTKKKLTEKEELALKKRELEILRAQLELQEGLPHLYGFKWYSWAKEFFDSRNRENFLCAANQISKSSTQIRKAIDWATDPSKWQELWPSLMAGQKPNQFWYFYPTGDTAQTEFETKWEPQFLPRGKYKDHPIYGWNEFYDKGLIKKIEFNSGVTIYFKTYSQKIKDLQSGTVYSIFCFPAGTKIHTEFGEKNIEDVTEEDSVLSHKGFRRVIARGSRVAPVRELEFLKASLRVTDEHPFFTNRGWVEAKDLRPGDVCFKTPICLRELLRIWYSFKEKFTPGKHGPRTVGYETTGAPERALACTSIFGKLTTENLSGAGTLSTTPTSTLWITRLKIYVALLGRSTLEFIKSRSGKRLKLSRSLATSVRKIFFLEHLRKILPAFVHGFVAAGLGSLRLAVSGAIKSSWLAKIASSDSVVKNAPISGESRVYSITVDDAHTYFANDFLTHNCDEEMPVEFVPELQARLNASDGYFHMVFTATIGQLYWAQTMEPTTASDEKYPNAWKKTVSVFECKKYIDGTDSHWTDAKIQRAIAKCPTDAEVQRRIYGRFIKTEGLMFPSFDVARNTSEYHPPPKHWQHFSGVDPGTGGSAHPAAIVFIAVSPDFKHGRVWRAWRGDGINTASPDIFAKYRELRGKLTMTAQKYDWASKEFFLHVSSKGESFSPANKDHVSGYSLLNTLFKSGMLKIYREDPELEKLISEIRSLSATGDKRKSKDDLCDALRHAANAVPWDFSDLELHSDGGDQFAEIKGAVPKTDSEKRRDWFMGSKESEQSQSVEDELEYWNEAQEP